METSEAAGSCDSFRSGCRGTDTTSAESRVHADTVHQLSGHRNDQRRGGKSRLAAS